MATAAERRKAQNRGVKAGTVRIGAKGKTVRRYNAKTGRWDVTKKNVKPGVQLAKPGTRATRSVSTGSAPSSLKPRGSSPSVRPASRASEGPKRSVKKKSTWESFANNPVGYVARGSSGRVVANKTSDFPKGTKLQLRKTRRKDSSGRDIYQWSKSV
jgi:hypothetical protein